MFTYEEVPVTVTVGEKEFSETYKQIKRDSVSVDDILTLLQDPKTAKEVINNWHYGQDLKAKSVVRQVILAKQAGPEKSINKLAKDIFKMRAANGKPVTEEVARKLAVALSQASEEATA
jgi:hypothetical protein